MKMMYLKCHRTMVRRRGGSKTLAPWVLSSSSGKWKMRTNLPTLQGGQKN